MRLRAVMLAVICAFAGCSPDANVFLFGNGNIRAVQGSPNMGPVDIYIFPVGAARSQNPTVANLPYGRITPYATLQEGSYNYDVLPAGAPQGGTPLISGDFTLTAHQDQTLVLAGEVNKNAQAVTFIEPSLTAGQSALIVHHASPYIAGVLQPIAFGLYDAATVSGTPLPSQTTQLFAFSFTPGLNTAPTASNSVADGQYFLSPVPTADSPSKVGVAAGAQGANGGHLASVVAASPLSTIIPGYSGFPPNASVSLFIIDSSSSSATVIGTSP